MKLAILAAGVDCGVEGSQVRDEASIDPAAEPLVAEEAGADADDDRLKSGFEKLPYDLL